MSFKIDHVPNIYQTQYLEMSIIGKKPLQLIQPVFAEHRAFVQYCTESSVQNEEREPRLEKLTQSYLKMLGSPNGNDILEEVCVCASGREPKAYDTKHGADSADGELEAKPMKTTYNAHISDDTPASLLRHQTIPYILLAEWTKDGVELLWALTTSYRIFDDARYRGILTTFPAEHRGATVGAVGATPLTVQELPKDLTERHMILEELVKLRERLITERNIPRYVRSNALPVENLATLQPGQYAIWVDSRLEKSRGKAHRILWKLWKQQQDPFVLDDAFIQNTEEIRRYFASRI